MNQPIRPRIKRDTTSKKRTRTRVSASRDNKKTNSKSVQSKTSKRFSLDGPIKGLAIAYRLFIKALSVSVIILVVGVIGFGGYKLLPYINPDIKQVGVTGELVRLDRADFTQIVQDNLIGGIVTLDMAYLRSELLAVPWVKQVELIKYFPDTLEVRVHEEQALAQWNELGYISIEGEFIKSKLQPDLQHLPQLSSNRRNAQNSLSQSASHTEADARQAIGLFHSLNSVVLAEKRSIKVLNQSASGGWTMVWDNGLSIDLGRSNYLLRTRHAMAAWQRLPTEIRESMNRIDARYDNGVAIKTGKTSTAGDNAVAGQNERKNQITEQSRATLLSSFVGPA